MRSAPRSCSSVGKSHPPECQYRISTCQWPEERESVRNKLQLVSHSARSPLERSALGGSREVFVLKVRIRIERRRSSYLGYFNVAVSIEAERKSAYHGPGTLPHCIGHQLCRYICKGKQKSHRTH